MSLARWAIEKNRIAAVILVAIVYAGVTSYLGMPRNQDPGFTIRVAQVLTYFPGASPERVEQLVTEPLEEAIMEMPELDFVTSTSKTGVSVVIVQVLESYTDMRPIWDRLRRKIDRASRQLPEGVQGPFVNDEFGDVFGLVLALTGDGYTNAELNDVAKELRDELLRIPNAAKVEIYGTRAERIFVEYENAALADLGLTPQQLLGLLQQRNIIIPGGSVYTDNEAIVLEPSGNFESLEDLKRTVIRVPGSDKLTYLEDIARVERAYVDPPDRLMRYDGWPPPPFEDGTERGATLGLGVSLREGGNIIELGDQVTALMDDLISRYPVGIDYDTVTYLPDTVERKVSDFEMNLLQAILIVLAVMLVTLGLRTGLLVASLVPTTIVMSLLIMSLFDIGLDQISLASLIIALGMLVDNAIVMAESIMVQVQAGKSRVQAAIDSAKELRVALLTSSLTTAAAFLPIFLAESQTGEYTAPIFKVVTITLLSSWVLALTLIPLLAVKLMKVKEKKRAGYSSWFYRLYRKALATALNLKWVSLAALVGVFFAAMQLFQYIPVLFFPPNDEPFLTAELKMPVGTPLEKTLEVARDVEDYALGKLTLTDEQRKKWADGDETQVGLTSIGTFIGGGEPRFVLTYNPQAAEPSFAVMLMRTTSYEAGAPLTDALEQYALEHHPDLEITVRPLANGPPVVFPIAIRVSGRDTDEIFRIADRVEEIVRGTPGTKNVGNNWGRRTKKLMVKVDPERAQRAGVTNEDVAASLQTMLSGFSSTEYREDDDVIPIVLRSVAADRDDIGKLESLNVYSSLTGRPVPLKQVAEVDVQWQPSGILRRQGLKTVTVTSQLEPGYNAVALTREIAKTVEKERKAWLPGYKYELGGEVETSGKANQSIADKLPIALFIILILLVGQFNSIRRAGIIFMTIPLGLIGVAVGLLITGSYMGFMTFLGIISLAGIVINNAIVLLERVQIEESENGLPPAKALIAAAQTRMRPILLTTATTVGGLIPLWFGGVMFEPMAISIIFGLIFATVLTLGAVPVLYALLFRIKGFSAEDPSLEVAPSRPAS